MSARVQRDDIVDYETYNDSRAEVRRRIMEVKRPRRIHLGDHLTFLFENKETLRYQIQEILRAEKTVREAAILHEIDVYNSMLGGPGDLGCALLIEIEEESERREKLTAWRGLEKNVYVRLEDGRRVYATYDPTQVGEDRLSAVQYLKFELQYGTPTAVGTDFPALTAEVPLTDEQQAALLADLNASRAE